MPAQEGAYLRQDLQLCDEGGNVGVVGVRTVAAAMYPGSISRSKSCIHPRSCIEVVVTEGVEQLGWLAHDGGSVR